MISNKQYQLSDNFTRLDCKTTSLFNTRLLVINKELEQSPYYFIQVIDSWGNNLYALTRVITCQQNNNIVPLQVTHNNFTCGYKTGKLYMTNVNIEQARFNMVEQQIRPWNVFDNSILNLISKVPREDFVPPQYRNLAFSDNEIPIGFNQVMMNPKIEARLLQALTIKANETVLEIGTGSGYLTALLATVARFVVSVEIVPELKEQAEAKLKAHGIVNVSCECDDASGGWPQNGPYDVIVVTGSIPMMHHSLQESLNIGGRLFAVIGEGPAMSAQLIQCIGKNQFTQHSLFETELAPLANVPHTDKFIF